jgi:CheY-like chemotaxis protein
MGGILRLRSIPGEGSVFYFALNLPSVTARRVTSRDEFAAVERLVPGTQVRALVVDDIPENREVLSLSLTLVGCDAAVAKDGEEALERMRTFRPQIVFLDMRLPGMSGLEAARRISDEWGADVKLVAMSASALEHERERYLKAGCDDFVSKPFRVERIYRCLANLLHVRFVTKEALQNESDPDGTIDLGQLILDEDLAQRLATAAELHSATVIKSCLREVEQLGAPGLRLAQHLRKFLASYDMKTIQRVVAQIPVHPAAEQQPDPAP